MDNQVLIAILGLISAAIGLAKAYVSRRQEIVHREEVVHRLVGGDPAAPPVPGDRQPTPPVPPAQAEAQRLRARLLAEPYDIELRRAYLSARTSNLLELDRQDGRDKVGVFLPAILFAGLVLGGCLGAILGVETQEAKVLGISVGREFKSINPVPVVLFGLAGVGLAYAFLRPVWQKRLATLWVEVGPVPDELAQQASDKVKKRLFGHKTGWFG